MDEETLRQRVMNAVTRGVENMPPHEQRMAVLYAVEYQAKVAARKRAVRCGAALGFTINMCALASFLLFPEKAIGQIFIGTALVLQSIATFCTLVLE